MPVLVDFAAGWVGVVAPPARARAVARAIIGQLAVHYSPVDLAVVLDRSCQGPDWVWVSQLPHAHEEGSEQASTPIPEGHRMLVVTADAGGLRPVSGLHVLSLAARAADLPAPTVCTLELTRERWTLLGGPEQVSELTVDEVPVHWAAAVAARLGPLRDAGQLTGPSRIPERVRLLELLAAIGVATTEADVPDLTRHWAASPRSTRFPIGAGASGPLMLDLVRDGPHTLVAGTTGSGKSELLVSLVAGLAAVNRPDELCFVLVDYKGGAAFGTCAQLPHVVGVVTDLDHQLTERALVSLDAELKRRERLLGAAGVADLAAYGAVRAPSDPAIPRLVLVVDEFRSLAEELPHFVAGLVRVASLGRSLGVHLVVATQRPGGVVTADMRANLGLRVALRVRDVIDSIDVVECADAAAIAEATPGRAVVTSAATALTTVQTAIVTCPAPRADTPPVRLAAIDGVLVPELSLTDGTPTDFDVLVASAQRAVHELAVPLPRSPWLPPLPTALRLDTLSRLTPQPPHVPEWVESAVTPRGVRPLALGLADHPGEQRQSVWSWNPERDGHLGVSGGPRTGRSSTLRTIASALAAGSPTTDVHLYAVHTGALSLLDGWAAVGASVEVEDLPRLDRLLDVLQESGADDTAYRVVLVDDWERVCECLDRARAGALRDRLAALLRLGPAQRLAFCVTGGRTILSGAIAQALAKRVLLLPADPVDLTLAGLTGRAVPARSAPGRGLDLATAAEVQFAVTDAVPDAVTDGSPGPSAGHPCVPDWAVPVLPGSVSLSSLASPDGLVVIGTDGHRSRGFRPAGGERRIVV
ncbi:MAG: FtsK/SpoIIIE domain-containing protein, partial [Candidatus Phosphoribacter sp.]